MIRLFKFQYQTKKQTQIYIVIQMPKCSELSQQLLNQLRNLLDKPIAKNSLSQIHSLLRHSSLPIYRALLVCLQKNRGDLLMLILTQNLLINQNEYGKSVNDCQITILETILFKSFMKYKIEEVITIWRLVLLKNHGENYQELRQFRLKYGYQEIVKQGVKVTDLQRKDRLFALVCENIKLLFGQGHKDLIISISQSYFKIFEKLLIYEKHYVAVALTILQIFNSHSNRNQQKQEQNDQQCLPNLSEQIIYMVLMRVETIIINTLAKPFHLLHRQCLLTLSLIAEQYAILKPGKQTNYQHIKNSAIKILKSIEAYLYRKPVRDEARKAYQSWKIVQNYQKQVHLEKMEKIKESVLLSLISNNKKLSEEISKQAPVLIEDVLQKANMYQSKYNVPIIDNSRYIAKSGLFLKKGHGVGGGKAQLQNSPQKTVKKQRRYQQIVESCLSGKHKISFRIPLEQQEQPFQIIQRQIKSHQPNIQAKTTNSVNLDRQLIIDNWKTKNDFREIIEACESNFSNTNLQQEDSQYNEICELIDLAYSYKFVKEAQ